MYRLSGLVTGLDTETLISQLVAIERQPITILENRQKTYEFRKELWNEINTSLLALKTKNDELRSLHSLTGKTAVSSNEEILTATAETNAVNAIYEITVNTLAQAHKVASKKESEIGVVSAGTFRISDGTITVDISVGDNATLADIRDSINSAKDGEGNDLDVTASIIDNTLVIKRDETGSTEMTFSDISGNVLETIGVIDGTGVIQNELQAAKDALFYVDGLEIIRSSNTGIDDVISGVTLNLTATGTATLEVNNDVDAAYKKIQDFVNQYNSTLDLINTRLSEKPVEDPETDSEKKIGLLRGDYSLAAIKDKLRRIISSTVSGQEEYDSLAEIGITTTNEDFGKSGKLVIDESKLKEALKNNALDVENLFVRTDVGISEQINDHLYYLTSSTTGMIASKTESFDNIIKDFDEQIESAERRLDQFEANLWRKFTEMERAISAMQNQGTWLNAQIANMFMG